MLSKKILTMLIVSTIFSVVHTVDCIGQIAGNTDRGYKQTSILDMVLIYQGGVHRVDWTPAEMLPYVIHTDRFGNKKWFFDGFLFLEFYDGARFNFCPDYSGKENARKKEWEWLIDRHFADGKAIKALNACIADGIREIGEPTSKHKVVIGMPEPFLNQKDWGTLDGKELDFSIREDRITASKWYIDRLIERFEQSGLDNIELAGFYWVNEHMSTSDYITVDIGNYTREKGKQFYWIPYYMANGYSQWKSYGFDVAYLQPNYFFNKRIDDNRVINSCDLAYTHNMALEMEFDGRALANSKENHRDRLVNYIQTFKRKGVFENASIAYYEGGRGVYWFSKSSDPKDREMIDTLAYFVSERRNRMFEKSHYREDFTQTKTLNEKVWEVENKKNLKFTNAGLEISSGGKQTKLHTKNKINIKYGRVEVDAKILSPKPDTKIRIHLVPVEEKLGSWPSSGELFLNSYNAAYPKAIHVGANTDKMNENMNNIRSSVFHIDNLLNNSINFVCEWSEKTITFYINGFKVNIQEDLFDKIYSDYPNYWPFNELFYLEISVESSNKNAAVCLESVKISTSPEYLKDF